MIRAAGLGVDVENAKGDPDHVRGIVIVENNRVCPTSLAENVSSAHPR